jgi:hypothetical protein
MVIDEMVAVLGPTVKTRSCHSEVLIRVLLLENVAEPFPVLSRAVTMAAFADPWIEAATTPQARSRFRANGRMQSPSGFEES